MNERDSETVAGLLEQMGYARAARREGADVIVVNTCSVRENADNRFFGMLGQIKHVKEARPDAVVAVCGCMMQQEHIVSRIQSKHAWVDLVFGTHNIHELPDMIETVLGREKVVRVREGRDGIVEGLPARRAYGFKAYVNIMYGCNNFCTYCIVPYTRGREVSRRPEHILSEARALAGAGTKEITLLGQNVNSYEGSRGGAGGREAGKAACRDACGAAGDGGGLVDFAELLRRVDAVDGIARIRFMTSHPKDLSDRLIALYAPGGPRALCPSIHLPVQSGSSRVLARMNRKYAKEDYLRLVEKLRAACPDIVISTDFIVGFPGETEADFADTMDLIERVRFDSAFTFLYSPRNGTPAADYPETVSGEAAHARFDRMTERLNAISFEKNRLYVGRTEQVLVEGPSKSGGGMLCGRTFGGKLVNFPGLGAAPPDALVGESRASAMGAKAGEHASETDLVGRIVPVRIAAAHTFSFAGEVVR